MQDILAFSEHATSLDAPLDDDPQASLIDLLPGDHANDPDAQAEHHKMTVLVRDWLKKLSDKQRLVITRRFGLDNDDPATLEELASDASLLTQFAIIRTCDFFTRSSAGSLVVPATSISYAANHH